MKGSRLFLILAVLALAASQISSYVVNRSLDIGRSLQVFGPVYVTHVRNHGGIFGVFQGQGWVFAAVSAIILIVVVSWVYRSEFAHRVEYLCFGLVVGGGASNILDRVIYGSVVDFIDIHGIPYWNYIFNTADVLIHVGIWPLFAIGIFLNRQPENGAVADVGDVSTES